MYRPWESKHGTPYNSFLMIYPSAWNFVLCSGIPLATTIVIIIIIIIIIIIFSQFSHKSPSSLI